MSEFPFVRSDTGSFIQASAASRQLAVGVEFDLRANTTETRSQWWRRILQWYRVQPPHTPGSYHYLQIYDPFPVGVNYATAEELRLALFNSPIIYDPAGTYPGEFDIRQATVQLVSQPNTEVWDQPPIENRNLWGDPGTFLDFYNLEIDYDSASVANRIGIAINEIPGYTITYPFHGVPDVYPLKTKSA